MTKKASWRNQSALFVGASLVVLGSLLPWKCVGDIGWYCSAGIDIDLHALTFLNPSGLMIAMIGLVAAGLIITTIDSIQHWHGEIITLIVAAGLWYLLIDNSLVKDNGGLVLIILCGITLWCIRRFAAHSQRASTVIPVNLAILIALALYHLASILLTQVAEKGGSGGTSLEYGVQVVIFGVLVMLATHVLSYRPHHGPIG